MIESARPLPKLGQQTVKGGAGDAGGLGESLGGFAGKSRAVDGEPVLLPDFARHGKEG